MLRIANPMLLLSLFFVQVLFAHEQLILVIADDMNRSNGTLQRYEYHGELWEKHGEAVTVNLGRNGMGWGIGSMPIPHAASDPVKHEGDGRAPAGIFTLGPVFGYADHLDTAMPYLQAKSDLVCVDDSRSKAYNRIVAVNAGLSMRSFEWMHRKDGLYRMGVVVHHNEDAVPGRGSCIFLHIQRAAGAGTAGCTSMEPAALASILYWLDPAKAPLLVQVPRKTLSDVERLFIGIGR